jgi:hypothetical protein
MEDVERGGGVFPVISARKFAAKFNVAKLPGPPPFSSSPGTDWNHEFKKHAALGNGTWFIPRNANSFLNVFCYREHSGVPWELTHNCRSAARANRPRFESSEGGGNAAPLSCRALPTSSVTLERTHLSIPVTEYSDDRKIGFVARVHRGLNQLVARPNCSAGVKI